MTTFLYKTLVRPVEIVTLTIIAIWFFWDELPTWFERPSYRSGDPNLITAAILPE